MNIMNSLRINPVSNSLFMNNELFTKKLRIVQTITKIIHRYESVIDGYEQMIMSKNGTLPNSFNAFMHFSRKNSS